jgi:class 3 adenylate cyclase
MAVRLVRQAEKSARCNPHLGVVGHRPRGKIFFLAASSAEAIRRARPDACLLIRVSDEGAGPRAAGRAGSIRHERPVGHCLDGGGGAAMRTVAEWLASIGLRQYAQRFAERAIDLPALRELTDRELAELGVLPEHRRRMLRAIAALHAAPLAPAATTEAVSPDAAERRQLTMMFCDLVDPSAVSARLDPEDVHRLNASYRACIDEVFGRYHGMIALYMGEGVLAYFCHSGAQEDDAEQSVRAALALVDAVANHRPGADVALQARIGIATGTVIVGELLGNETPAEQTVIGDAPNLAARLQTLAEPGAVLICPRTHRLAGAQFDCRDLGPVALQGRAEPVSVWQVLGPREAVSRA